MGTRLAVFIFLLLSVMDSRSQDLGSFAGGKALVIHGSLGAEADFYRSNESYPTRPPFAWNINGSLTPVLYGVNLPFSFVVTQYGKSYASPFTYIGISPSYKWVKLHLGYRTMLFSPLVFAGQSFLGGGIELSPKGFYFGGWYGLLNKAVQEGTSFAHPIEPQYRRIGYGFKFGIGSPKNNVSISFF